MAKTKEEIIQFLKSKNWGAMWIENIERHSTCVVPSNLDGHLDKMFSHYPSLLERWIICNAVSIRNTPQGTGYWEMVQNEWRRWYNS